MAVPLKEYAIFAFVEIKQTVMTLIHLIFDSFIYINIDISQCLQVGIIR